MIVFLRRKNLGRTSCRGIKRAMKAPGMIIRNDLYEDRVPENAKMIVRWGCTGKFNLSNVLNKAESISLVNNKYEFRKTLNEAQLSPKTWFDPEDADIIYPCIVRPEKHAQGRRLWLCNNKEELDQVVEKHKQTKLGYQRLYISEYISKIKEFRVFVGSGRVIWVAEKTPGNPKEIAWNVAKGGKFENVRWMEWDKEVIRTALEAFNLTGLDFGGVDVMLDENGNSYVLEINSAPSQTSEYRQNCVAKYLDYIVLFGKEPIPVTTHVGKYLPYIHPCLTKKAIL